MMSTGLIFAIIILYTQYYKKCSACQTKEEFKQQCEQQFNGVADGSHCFFLAPAADWDGAWDGCKQNGSVLAQIHTDSEWTQITAYIRRQYPANASPNIWIAGRHASTSSSTCSAPTDTTYWYDSQSTKNTQMVAANTWLRTHSCDARFNQDADCLKIVSYFNGTTNIDDNYCNRTLAVLCQYTGSVQNFTMTTTCMVETPIQKFTATQAQDCANACATKMWCRSFNYKISSTSNSCELFSWSIYDTGSGGPTTTTGVANCYHYNYTP